MIEKVEINEFSFDQNNVFITIDITNNQIIYKKNNVIIKNEKYYIDTKYITDLVKDNITYWDNEYIDNNVIDGLKSELKIYTDKENIQYKFINKFPDNYNEFITKIKKMVNIL